MQNIYLDNASTSFPKPPEVAQAMYQYMTESGTNINRGTSLTAYSTADAVFETRQLLCDFFHAEDPKNVVFTKNITEALNVLIKGYLCPGDHVLVSSLEHNAVMRPLQQIGEELVGDETDSFTITFSRIGVDSEGCLLLHKLEKLIRPNTKAVIMTHASNVCGTIMPIAEVGAFCHKHNLKFIVDCAQSAGIIPIDMQAMHIDALAFTGHKGLLGPQGIGGFILREEMIPCITPFIVGGTGSMSHTEKQPAFMPDKFEAGTPNIPGIIGLGAALRWLNKTGIDKLRQKEMQLTQKFLNNLLALEFNKRLHIIGRHSINGRIGVISIATNKCDIADLAHNLAQHYGIATRVGLHCAPAAHKALGTYPTGTLRFSFGWNNTEQDVKYAITALNALIRH